MYGVEVSAEVRDGTIVESTTKAALDYGANLIVVGTYRHSALKHYITGNIVDRLLQVAPCPVLALITIARACQTCHPYPETEIQARVDAIQERTHALMNRSAAALMDLFDAVSVARKAGATDAQLQNVFALHLDLEHTVLQRRNDVLGLHVLLSEVNLDGDVGGGSS